MRTLTGRVAVVTGAANGLGLGLARRFLQEGMKVVLADVDDGDLRRAAAGLAELGFEVTTVVTDVADERQVSALARTAVEAHGQVHVLCNNAGVGAPQSFDNTGQATWDWTLGVDLWGVVHGCRTFLPVLARAEEAHIINTASMAGLVHSRFLAAYSVAKAGVVALSESLRDEFTQTHPNIGVSVLCPGYMRTSIRNDERHAPEGHVARAAADAEFERLRESVGARIDGGATTATVAGMVVDAIKTNRPYIVTDPSMVDIVRARFEGIVAAFDAGD